MNIAVDDESLWNESFRLIPLFLGFYFSVYFYEIVFFPEWLSQVSADSLRIGGVVGLVAAAMLVLDIKTKWTALVVWVLSVCFLNLIPAAREIQVSHLNLLLLFVSFVSFDPGPQSLTSRALQKAVVVIYGLSYFYSGAAKLISDDWMTGKNILVSLQFLRSIETAEMISQMIVPFLSALALVVGVFEIMVFPFVLVKKTRRPMIFAVTTFHVLIGLGSDLQTVSLGMIVYNALVLQILRLPSGSQYHSRFV